MLRRIGLDIAKNVFQAHRVDAKGKVEFRKKLARAKVLEFFGNLSPAVVGIAALSRLGYQSSRATLQLAAAARPTTMGMTPKTEAR
jgi:transposase